MFELIDRPTANTSLTALADSVYFQVRGHWYELESVEDGYVWSWGGKRFNLDRVVAFAHYRSNN